MLNTSIMMYKVMNGIVSNYLRKYFIELPNMSIIRGCITGLLKIPKKQQMCAQIKFQ